MALFGHKCVRFWSYCIAVNIEFIILFLKPVQYNELKRNMNVKHNHILLHWLIFKYGLCVMRMRGVSIIRQEMSNKVISKRHVWSTRRGNDGRIRCRQFPTVLVPLYNYTEINIYRVQRSHFWAMILINHVAMLAHSSNG